MLYPITSKRLLEAMNDKGITAYELAKRSGVGKSSISHYTNGNHVPHNVNASRLAKVLGVNPLWLMGLEDVKENIHEQPLKEGQEDLRELVSIAENLEKSQLARLLAYAQGLSDLQERKK